MKLYKPQNLL